MIRTLLAEVLEEQGVRSARVSSKREEHVRLTTDGDLAAFVNRVLDLAADPKACAEIRSGRRVFRLSKPDTAQREIGSPKTGQLINSERNRAHEIKSGLVTERQVRELPVDVGIVQIGSNVRITPLASDAMRQVGIKIRRVKS